MPTPLLVISTTPQEASMPRSKSVTFTPGSQERPDGTWDATVTAVVTLDDDTTLPPEVSVIGLPHVFANAAYDYACHCLRVAATVKESAI